MLELLRDSDRFGDPGGRHEGHRMVGREGDVEDSDEQETRKRRKVFRLTVARSSVRDCDH